MWDGFVSDLGCLSGKVQWNVVIDLNIAFGTFQSVQKKYKEIVQFKNKKQKKA